MNVESGRQNIIILFWKCWLRSFISGKTSPALHLQCRHLWSACIISFPAFLLWFSVLFCYKLCVEAPGAWAGSRLSELVGLKRRCCLRAARTELLIIYKRFFYLRTGVRGEGKIWPALLSWGSDSHSESAYSSPYTATKGFNRNEDYHRNNKS